MVMLQHAHNARAQARPYVRQVSVRCRKAESGLLWAVFSTGLPRAVRMETEPVMDPIMDGFNQCISLLNPQYRGAAAWGEPDEPGLGVLGLAAEIGLPLLGNLCTSSAPSA